VSFKAAGATWNDAAGRIGPYDRSFNCLLNFFPLDIVKLNPLISIEVEASSTVHDSSVFRNSGSIWTLDRMDSVLRFKLALFLKGVHTTAFPLLLSLPEDEQISGGESTWCQWKRKQTRGTRTLTWREMPSRIRRWEEGKQTAAGTVWYRGGDWSSLLIELFSFPSQQRCLDPVETTRAPAFKKTSNHSRLCADFKKIWE